MAVLDITRISHHDCRCVCDARWIACNRLGHDDDDDDGDGDGLV